MQYPISTGHTFRLDPKLACARCYVAKEIPPPNTNGDVDSSSGAIFIQASQRALEVLPHFFSIQTHHHYHHHHYHIHKPTTAAPSPTMTPKPAIQLELYDTVQRPSLLHPRKGHIPTQSHGHTTHIQAHAPTSQPVLTPLNAYLPNLSPSVCNLLPTLSAGTPSAAHTGEDPPVLTLALLANMLTQQAQIMPATKEEVPGAAARYVRPTEGAIDIVGEEVWAAAVVICVFWGGGGPSGGCGAGKKGVWGVEWAEVCGTCGLFANFEVIECWAVFVLQSSKRPPGRHAPRHEYIPSDGARSLPRCTLPATVHTPRDGACSPRRCTLPA
ncbi:hypothetical protein BU17DRAFT_72148 [Hysterangium stoloniferum]|nr:hypothetical protein BU17DRAFT_72148 [Hysterangium stoloniferum]